MLRKIVCLLFLLSGLYATAQVTVEAKIDSTELLVGEQTNITLKVSADANRKVQFPIFSNVKELTKGVEVVEESKVDTQRLNEGKRFVLEKKYIVTAFDSSLYYIPPFEVKVEGKVYKSNSLAMKVLTIDVDTLHPNSFFGPKTIMDAPFVWSDWSGLIGMSLLLLIFFVVFFYLFVRLRENKPIIRKVKVEPVIPPHQWAIGEIEKIKSEKLWAQENSKEYYTKLTDTLRSYIERRYGFSAMEMTSEEIVDRLLRTKDDHTIAELRQLLFTADLVKFAKYNTPINENDANLLKAIDFINTTKVEIQEAQKNVKPVVTIEEMQGQRTRMGLRIGVIVIGLVSVAILYFIVKDACNLLF